MKQINIETNKIVFSHHVIHRPKINISDIVNVSISIEEGTIFARFHSAGTFENMEVLKKTGLQYINGSLDYENAKIDGIDFLLYLYLNCTIDATDNGLIRFIFPDIYWSDISFPYPVPKILRFAVISGNKSTLWEDMRYSLSYFGDDETMDSTYQNILKYISDIEGTNKLYVHVSVSGNHQDVSICAKIDYDEETWNSDYNKIQPIRFTLFGTPIYVSKGSWYDKIFSHGDFYVREIFKIEVKTQMNTKILTLKSFCYE